MSKTVTAAIDTAIVQDHVEACHLVQIDFPSGRVYLTDAPHNITWGGNTYIGVGAIGSIQHADETDKIEATPLRFVLAGPISSLLSSAMNERIMNREVLVYVAFFTNGVIIADPVLEWKGRGDVMSVGETGSDQGGTSTIQLTAESRYAIMLRPKPRMHNNEDQQIDHPGDKFYEFLPALTAAEIIWPAASYFRQ